MRILSKSLQLAWLCARCLRHRKTIAAINRYWTERGLPVHQAVPAPTEKKELVTPLVLHLSDEEFVGLGVFSKAHYNAAAAPDVARAAEMILRVALANPAVTSRMINAHANHRDAEGFAPTALSDRSILLATIRTRPQYREAMLRARLVEAE